jgi:ribose transport system substrate-binding protein
MDRNDDMLPYIEDGAIYGAVAQKSYLEIFLAFQMMHWQNTDALKVLPDWKAAGANPLPEWVESGVMPITAENVGQFKHVLSLARRMLNAPGVYWETMISPT